MEIRDLKNRMKRELYAIGCSPAQADAEVSLILEKAAGIPRETLYRSPDKRLDAHILQAVDLLMRRRITERQPVQYLLGEADFYGLTFRVTPSVLIPRPETELLVETAAALCRKRQYASVLDVGTGSGCIAVALKKELGEAASVIATDISTDALAIATENAGRLGAAVDFRRGAFFEPVPDETFDLIVSNPPYVGEAEKPAMTPEVLQHEPQAALFAEEGKYAFYERFAAEAGGRLKPGGAVLLEIGAGMGERVAGLLGNAGFGSIEIIPDYAGHERLVLAFANS